MTKKEAEKIGKNLIQKLPEFEVKGNLIFIRPIGNLLRGICLESSGSDKDKFYANIFIQPLYVPTEKYIVLSIGWRIGGGSYRWDSKDPNLFQELGEAIKQEAIPFFKKTQSPRDIPGTVEKWKKDPFNCQAIAYSFARMDVNDKAVKAFDQLIKLIDIDGAFPWQMEMTEIAKSFKQQLLTNPTEAQQQLDEWENETLKNLGLEQYR